MTRMDGDDVRGTAPDPPERAEALLRDRDTWVEAPPGLSDDLLAALRRERDSAGGSIGSPDPVRPAGDDTPVGGRGWGRRHLMAVAAATVLAAVAAGVVVEITGDTTGGSSGDSQVLVLAGGAGTPQASGRAEIAETPSGFEITLDVEGLPPAPAGGYYQAWLKNAAGDLVTIGTFHAREGSDAVVLWSGVDPADYPTLTVTLQQEGAGTDSSGNVLLSGTLA